MTQKEFILGLIEQELSREQAERERLSADRGGFPAEGEKVSDEEETAVTDDSLAVCGNGEDEEEPDEEEEEAPVMGM